MPVVAAIFGFLGTTISSLFGFKGAQAASVQKALDVITSVNQTDAAVIPAQANAIAMILTQGSWLERNWRPFLMLILIVMIGCWFFGYIPHNFNGPISPMMREVLDILKIGVMGYVPARTLEKIVTQFNISAILKQLIEKKVV